MGRMNSSFEPKPGEQSVSISGSRKVEEIKDGDGHAVYVVPLHPEIASDFVPPAKITYEKPHIETHHSSRVVLASEWYPMLAAQKAQPHPLVLAIKSIVNHLPHPHR